MKYYCNRSLYINYNYSIILSWNIIEKTFLAMHVGTWTRVAGVRKQTC